MQVSHIGYAAFENLTLTNLLLHHNALSMVDVGLTANASITNLDVSYNSVTTLELAGASLCTLDASHNELTTLTATALQVPWIMLYNDYFFP